MDVRSCVRVCKYCTQPHKGRGGCGRGGLRGEEGSNEVKRTQSKVGGVNTSLQRQRRAISRQQDEGPLGRGLRLLTGGRLRQQRGRIITTAIFAVRRRWRAPGSERPMNVCVCAQRGGADSRSGVCVCARAHRTAQRGDLVAIQLANDSTAATWRSDHPQYSSAATEQHEMLNNIMYFVVMTRLR